MLLLAQLFVLERSVLLASLPSLGDHRQSLLVRVLGLLLHADDFALGEELLRVARVCLARSGERSQLATRSRATTILGLLLRRSGAELVDLGKIGGRENLRDVSPWMREGGESEP